LPLHRSAPLSRRCPIIYHLSTYLPSLRSPAASTLSPYTTLFRSSVGKQGTLNANNCYTDHATTDTFTRERIRENYPDRVRDGCIVRTENHQNAGHVHNCHEWN